MFRLDYPSRILAVCFAMIAGYVDAVGFLISGGFFMSFMTGNTTRLAIGLSGLGYDALVAGGLLLLFVAGVVLGSSIGRMSGRYRRTVTMLFVSLCLLMALLVYSTAGAMWSVIPMALAMGTQNAVLAEDGEVMVAATYMTGNLVKMGKRITVALWGGYRWSWLPYLLLWTSLVCGAVMGAACYLSLGSIALIVAATAMAVLAIYARPKSLQTRA